MIRTYIVDDENIAQRRLTELLKGFKEIAVVGTAYTSSDAIHGIIQTKPDTSILLRSVNLLL